MMRSLRIGLAFVAQVALVSEAVRLKPDVEESPSQMWHRLDEEENPC